MSSSSNPLALRERCRPHASPRVTLLAALPILALAACGESSPATPQVAIGVAPLNLPGLADACYSLEVKNGASETVWSKTGICATAFGDSQGSISYVGPCDASDGVASNTVTLVLEDLFDTQGRVDRASYQNPCGDASLAPNDPGYNYDGFGACELAFTCRANSDVPVGFDITVMRKANQGFFDVAVNFEDIFCSAKVDCNDPTSGDPLELLFNPATNERDATAVAAFACYSGTSQTVLHMSDVQIVCPSSTYAVVPSEGPGNLVLDASTDEVLFAAAVYEGVQAQAGQGLSTWSVALGIDELALPATGCKLVVAATASETSWPNGFIPAAQTSYPVMSANVDLSIVAGKLSCGQHPLNGPTSQLVTTYIKGGIYSNTTFCNELVPGSADLTSTLPDCAVTNVFVGDDGGTAVLNVNGNFYSATAPPEAFVDGDGNVVAGTIAMIVTTDGFNGSFGVGGSDDIDPGLIADFTFVDENGNEVQVAPDTLVTIRIPLPLDSLYTAGEPIDFYSYDELLGTWQLTTTGVVVAEAGQLFAEASVPHFTWYGVQPAKQACVDVTITDANGNPLPDITVRSVVVPASGGAYYAAATGPSGTVCLKTRALSGYRASIQMPGLPPGTVVTPPLPYTTAQFTSVAACGGGCLPLSFQVVLPSSCDGLFVAGEECDGGANCAVDCTCEPGTLSLGDGSCTTCGNGFLDGGELCDPLIGTGENCRADTCECEPGFDADQGTCVPQLDGLCSADGDLDCDGVCQPGDNAPDCDSLCNASEDGSIDCDFTCQPNEDGSDCDTLCAWGEEGSIDCNNTCQSGDESGPDCNGRCEPGEDLSADCDTDCNNSEDSDSPDCNGRCEAGDWSGADCDAICGADDEAGSNDCTGMCDLGETGPDCDGVCQPGDNAPDCDSLCNAGEDGSIDCDFTCQPNEDGSDCDTLCAWGEEGSIDCDSTCQPGEESGPDCNSRCEPGEDLSADCDTDCNNGEDSASPDCNGRCEGGDWYGADCDTVCSVDDEAGSNDCTGMCDAGETGPDCNGSCAAGETGTDCDGSCQPGDEGGPDCDGNCSAGEDGSGDCDTHCANADTLDGPDCDGICQAGDSSPVDCNAVCDVGDTGVWDGGPDCDNTCAQNDAPNGPDCDSVCAMGDSLPGPDCDGVCDPTDQNGSPDCDNVCALGEQGSIDCDNTCMAGEEGSSDCNGVCASGETGVGECNGVCDSYEEVNSEDCDWACEPGEAGSFDCDTYCNGSDVYPSPDCDGVCAGADYPSVDCNGTCQPGETFYLECNNVCEATEGGSGDCDNYCSPGEFALGDSPDCTGPCTPSDAGSPVCNNLCDAADTQYMDGGPDCNGFCAPGEEGTLDCNGRCEVSDLFGSSDCDTVCGFDDEASSADCDGACSLVDDASSPDCEDNCEVGDALNGADCDGRCDFNDKLGSVDCNTHCETTDDPYSYDCNGACQLGDEAETRDCDGQCNNGDQSGSLDCDARCDWWDLGGPDCDSVCDPNDDPDGMDCNEICTPNELATSPDCDERCGPGETASSPDCNGICDGGFMGEEGGTPDCNGHCQLGETAPDCDNHCDVGDQRGSVDCDGVCGVMDAVGSEDCNGICDGLESTTLGYNVDCNGSCDQIGENANDCNGLCDMPGETATSDDCDTVCSDYSESSSDDCDGHCKAGEQFGPDCDGTCDLDDTEDSPDCLLVLDEDAGGTAVAFTTGGTFTVTAPANAFVDPNDSNATIAGDILLQVNPNPPIGNYAFGGGTLDLESKADIYFLSGSNYVQVAANASVTVVMPLPSTTGYVVGDTVDVFHYDTLTNTWTLDTQGTVVTSGNGLGVSFPATHFSVYAIQTSPTNTYNRSAGRRDFVNCFITLTGTIACAGETRNNVIGYEPAGTGWLSLAMTSFGHTCALHEDHHVTCWGDYGDPGEVPTSNDFVQIAAGQSHLCGLHADGSISCWGDNTFGQTDAPSGTGFVEVAAGADASCALDANRSPVCWGSNADPSVLPPSNLAGLSQLGMGWYGSCAIKSDGAVGCWGYFGPDPDTQIQFPSNVSGVDLLRVGDDSVTVLYPNGNLGSWAASSGGVSFPGPTGAGYTSIGTAQCAETGLGTTECWGSPWTGQTLRTGAGAFVSVAPSDYQGCALRQDGSIACWALLEDPPYTTAIPSGSGYKALATDGNNRYCAIKPNDELVCFGSTYPTAIVPPAGTFKFVAGTHGDTVQYSNGVSIPSGYAYNGNGISWHSGAFCGLRTDGSMACWGNTRAGAKVQTAQPGNDWVSITGGGTRWCAVRTNHTVLCWGVGSFGFIGAANETNVKKLLGADDGIQEACVLRNDNTIGCFGQYATVPPSGSDFVDLAKVQSTYCAVRTNGTMACWPNASLTPAGNDFVAVSGRSEMAALKSDGSIYVFSEKLIRP